MKFAFKLPTGIQICERTIKPTFSFKIEGIDFLLFDKNVYFSEGKVVTKQIKLCNYTTSYFAIFVQFDGHLFNLCHFTNKTKEECQRFVIEKIEQILIWKKEYSKILENLTEYNAKSRVGIGLTLFILSL